ncbi:hypothetical protein BGZ95_009783 [Linnemannia exigua]|uniref:Secreted protein n=1 Tax=Linnemannia exigua TaxID=604196 RepID=A0AAD4DEF2_9FUNG|nr:hypothetical protein BGZ95_009783 [Linnemannia exigua]
MTPKAAILLLYTVSPGLIRVFAANTTTECTIMATSESESEGDDDDDDDLVGDEDDDTETNNINVQVLDSPQCRLTRPAPAHLADTGSSASNNITLDSSVPRTQPQMEMIHRPVEMTSIIALSSTPSPSTATVATGTFSPQP